jgi:lysophospholipase L1-like esterase
MPAKGIIVAGTIALVVATAACSGNAKTSGHTTSPTGQSTANTTATATGSPDHPIGVIAVGHSWMTGYMSDPKSPGTDTVANSWATGTNPAVHSIYQRLVEARPETAAHVANVASDGAESGGLPDQAAEGLTEVPYPALLIVQIVGNDLRCDGTDPQHYPEFRDNVRKAVQTVLKASPNATVVLVGDPGRPSRYAKAIADLPTTPKDFIGTRPCYLFSANRTINQAGVARVTALLAAYEAQLAKACEGIQRCHTDGGAAARMELPIADYGQDLLHPSIHGHAHIAAAEWPVVAAALGLV